MRTGGVDDLSEPAADDVSFAASPPVAFDEVKLGATPCLVGVLVVPVLDICCFLQVSL